MKGMVKMQIRMSKMKYFCKHEAKLLCSVCFTQSKQGENWFSLMQQVLTHIDGLHLDCSSTFNAVY